MDFLNYLLCVLHIAILPMLFVAIFTFILDLLEELFFASLMIFGLPLDINAWNSLVPGCTKLWWTFDCVIGLESSYSYYLTIALHAHICRAHCDVQCVSKKSSLNILNMSLIIRCLRVSIILNWYISYRLSSLPAVDAKIFIHGRSNRSIDSTKSLFVYIQNRSSMYDLLWVFISIHFVIHFVFQFLFFKHVEQSVTVLYVALQLYGRNEIKDNLLLI